MRLLAAPDKFRGSLSAGEAAHAIAAGAEGAGWRARELPLADGGEGTLDALGGGNRISAVHGPLGATVDAAWRLADGVAVIEMARASGLALAGGAAKNDPVAATTLGTGELIAAALDQGASRIIVGVGGSATTDGGLGAVEALRARAPFQVPVEVACDVRTCFEDAAAAFGPQKGASPAQVEHLTARLRTTADLYARELDVDVRELPGSGAAGGLAGGLAALGARLVPGFELVAAHVHLDEELSGADVVVTGEGSVDETSFAGKVVGEVSARAGAAGVPVFVVAGEVRLSRPELQAMSLVDRFGAARAWREPETCISRVVTEMLRARGGSPPPAADTP